ncbi:hypothetical protein [Phreatobacter sp.]|uniref:SEL1-like repeat protein n=1 Tax=Phreatobacter sp. TaxID=1966341 RepID=UPI003F725683
MRHTVPWSVKGVDQDAREAAKDAARRSGMSLGEWLNAMIADQAVQREAEAEAGLASVTRRLDEITQRLDQATRRQGDTAIPRTRLPAPETGEIVRALDAVARLAELSERRSQAAIEAVEKLGSRPPPPAAASFAASPAMAPPMPPALSPAQSARAEAQARLEEIARSIRDLDHATGPAQDQHAEPARPRSLVRDIDATVAEIAARRRALETGQFPGFAEPSAPPPPRHEAAAAPPVRTSAPPPDFGPISDRIDQLSRQIEGVLARPAPRQPESDPGRNQILGEIRRLSQRIEDLDRPADTDPGRDQILGEIRRLSQRVEAIDRPADDGLARELSALSGRIEQMRAEMASGGERRETAALAGLRADIAAIAGELGHLAPRRAVESLEAEIHALAGRLDTFRSEGLSAGPIGQLVAEFERTVASLMPAEGIAEELRSLSARLDMLSGARSTDGDAIAHLSDQIGSLRAMLAGTVTRDAVDALSDRIAMLAGRIEDLAATRHDADREALSGAGVEAFAAAIEQRIEEIASRLESTHRAPQADRGPAASPQLEEALRRLTDRLEASHARPDDAGALADIERHLLALATKIDAADARFVQLGTIEQGLSDIFVQMEEMRASAIDAAERAARGAVADLADRATARGRVPDPQPTEVVRETLDRVVRRIAEIEAPPSQPSMAPAAPLQAAEIVAPPAREPAAAAHAAMAPVVAERAASPVSRRLPPDRAPGSVDEPLEPGLGSPRLRPPQPGSGQAPGTKTDFIAAARRAAKAAAAAGPDESPAPDVAERPSLFARLRGAGRGQGETAVEARIASAVQRPERSPQARIASGPAASGRSASPVDAEMRPAPPPIAVDRPIEPPAADAAEDGEGAGRSLAARLNANRRTILMGLAAALLLLAAGVTALPKLRGAPPAPTPAIQHVAPAATPPSSADPAASAVAPPAQDPALAAPASGGAATGDPPPAVTPVPAMDPPPAQPDGSGAADPAAAPATTGTVSPRQPLAPPGSAVSATGWQPVGGGQRAGTSVPPALREAADKGDPQAAFEMGTRHLEGRGVPVNAQEAARWYQRAADAGIVPAQYRLGSLYEKGTGVLRDFERARRLYERAAEAGNGKAMHNLAVMHAQGQHGGNRPDYRTAAQWFRRASDHGVTDSQYNLGILYGRGLGVDQSLAESYKWFSLAALGGDQDAAKKRDEVAGRIDAQTLAAARLAVQTFTAKPEPETAVRVATPAAWADEPARPARQTPRRAQSNQR